MARLLPTKLFPLLIQHHLKKENGIQSSAFLSILNFIAIFWWIEVHLGLGGLRGPLLGLGCLGFSQAKGTTTCQEIENGLAGPDSKHNQSLTFHSLSTFITHTRAKILNLSKNSLFETLTFHKIHNVKVSFFTKFTISKSHISQNSHF